MTVIMFLFPLAAAMLSLVIPAGQITRVNMTAAAVLLLSGITNAVKVFESGPYLFLNGLFYFDALNAYLLVVISLVGFIGCVYSSGYMAHELETKRIDERQYCRYYFWLYLFIFTMLMVVSANNLGLMWVAIEGTTLATALLVAFYNNKTSLEAAWKYIVICSVGITFALLGTILVYYAGTRVLGGEASALNWTELLKASGRLDPKLLKLAFTFILVGYGTKMGLVPMHTWLPDAHSQAPSPVSALLSGVLLNCALYGIIRFHILLKSSPAVGGGYSSSLLVLFGLVSLGFVVPFILLQHDFKRLLAYSSVEHMGIIAAAIGFGSKLALFGAFLHLFNHAMTKSLMFLTAGNILQKFGTTRMLRIKGIIKVMPVSGVLVVIGTLALTGVPPFGVFASEFTIISAAFAAGRFTQAALVLVFIALIFAGFMFYVSKMVMGSSYGRVEPGEQNRYGLAVLFVPLLAVTLAGLYLPQTVREILYQVVAVVGGND